jgi:hypothetical protein
VCVCAVCVCVVCVCVCVCCVCVCLLCVSHVCVVCIYMNRSGPINKPINKLISKLRMLSQFFIFYSFFKRSQTHTLSLSLTQKKKSGGFRANRPATNAPLQVSRVSVTEPNGGNKKEKKGK